ncbi:hypothetical protein [Nocardia australiensis]
MPTEPNPRQVAQQVPTVSPRRRPSTRRSAATPRSPGK